MLDSRIREHLKSRQNLFSEGTTGLATSLSRPLLVLFDRNFELSVVLQVIIPLLVYTTRNLEGTFILCVASVGYVCYEGGANLFNYLNNAVI